MASMAASPGENRLFRSSSRVFRGRYAKQGTAELTNFRFINIAYSSLWMIIGSVVGVVIATTVNSTHASSILLAGLVAGIGSGIGAVIGMGIARLLPTSRERIEVPLMSLQSVAKGAQFRMAGRPLVLTTSDGRTYCIFTKTDRFLAAINEALAGYGRQLVQTGPDVWAVSQR